jgi:hypothetical protein
LTAKHQEQVDRANKLLVGCLLILQAVVTGGGQVTLEHPEDPGTPYPSIWAMAYVMEALEKMGCSSITFPQCQWGSPARKLTTLAGNVKGLATFDRPCTHVRHTMVLQGRDGQGQHKTKMAQAYPSEMCRQLALIHVENMLTREPSGGDSQLGDTLHTAATRTDSVDLRSDRMPDAFLRADG